MDRRDLILQIKKDFSYLTLICEAVYLFGSYATGLADSRSDIDICLIAGPYNNPDNLLSLAWQKVRSDIYDIRIFEHLPLYLQMQVLKTGVQVICPDPPALSEYLYQVWKRWDDQRWYQR